VYQLNPGSLIQNLKTDILNNYADDPDKFLVLKTILQLRSLKSISNTALSAKINEFKTRRIMQTAAAAPVLNLTSL
jgi:hypothetical protein